MSAPVSTTRHRLEYQPALDGLRGLAVLAVVCFHAGFGWAKGGFLGVSAFFTLSGYLIAALLLRERASSGTIALGSFYARRVRRLLPAALGGLALAGAYVAFVGTPLQADAFRLDGLFALANLANWRFIAADSSYAHVFLDEVVGARSPVMHYWSLAIEEQFYLLFPPLAWLLLRRARRHEPGGAATPEPDLRWLTVMVMLLALASFGGALVATVVNAAAGAPLDRYYYGTDTRAGELLVGVLLAIALHRGPVTGRAQRALQWVGPVALVAMLGAWATIDVGRRGLFRGGLAMHAVLVAIVIVASASPGPLRAVLSFRPLRALGLVSYGVYVYHWPLFLWIDERHTPLSGLALQAVRAGATLLLAWVSYRWIERPVRSGAFPPPRLRPVIVPLAAAATAAIVWFTAVSVPPPSTVFAPLNAAPPVLPDPSPSGGPGAPERPLRVLIVGDSVAQTMGRGFERWGPEHDVAVWNRAQYYCGFGRAGEYKLGVSVRAPSPECMAWPDRFAESIGVFDPDLTVVLVTFWDALPRLLPGQPDWVAPGDPAFDAWLRGEYGAVADALTSQGGRVLWLTIPCNQGEEQADGYAAVNRVIRALAAERPDTVSVVDTERILCTPRPSLADARGDDGAHFTEAGADAFAAYAGARVQREAAAAAMGNDTPPATTPSTPTPTVAASTTTAAPATGAPSASPPSAPAPQG